MKARRIRATGGDAVRLRVFDVTRDKQGTPVYRHRADCISWRDTLRYRRLDKFQRTLPDKTSITSAVFDAQTGAFLCSP